MVNNHFPGLGVLEVRNAGNYPGNDRAARLEESM